MRNNCSVAIVIGGSGGGRGDYGNGQWEGSNWGGNQSSGAGWSGGSPGYGSGSGKQNSILKHLTVQYYLFCLLKEGTRGVETMIMDMEEI